MPVLGLLAIITWVAVAGSPETSTPNEQVEALIASDAIATGPISPTDVVSDAAKLQTAAEAGTLPTAASGIAGTVSASWLAQVATATGIPIRALAAYAGASLALASENPGCNLGWTTLAGIGNIESGHGTHGGAVLLETGYTDSAIRGPALDGGDFVGITDSDGGLWDGDTTWDRAVGPLQFIPQTWKTWGADGNGDGTADPNQIDDAALAAGRYLCHSGDMSTVSGWRAAIFSYNHDNSYVDSVAGSANRYATLSTR